MKKLLLTFALAGVVSAGAASSACAYCALAYNPATGWAGSACNCNTREQAEAIALKESSGGRIKFTGDTKAFYAFDRWRDGKGNTDLAWAWANSPNEAYRLADKWCSDRGLTIVKHDRSWQETVGSPSPAAYGLPSYAHVVIENRTGRTVHYNFTWGSAFKDVELKAGGHEDHWYKYNPNGVPRPHATFWLGSGRDDYNGLLFGFGNKPKRYIIQPDTSAPGNEYISDDLGRQDGFYSLRSEI